MIDPHMIDAQVTMHLSEFESIKEKLIAFEKLKKEIYSCSEVRSVDVGTNYPQQKVVIDYYKVTKLVLKYVDYMDEDGNSIGDDNPVEYINSIKKIYYPVRKSKRRLNG